MTLFIVGVNVLQPSLYSPLHFLVPIISSRFLGYLRQRRQQASPALERATRGRGPRRTLKHLSRPTKSSELIYS